MISIIVPLYNKEKVVRKSLESLKNQKYTDFELIIVDDGSTDRSVEIVTDFVLANESFANQSKFRLIHQVNGGVSAARNRGIEEARGEYIAFLDADDEWLPDYLSSMALLIQEYPLCWVLASAYCYRRKDGDTLVKLEGIFSGRKGILDNYFVVASISQPPLWTSAIIVRREIIKAIGGFPLGIRLGEDLITWATLACQYKIAYTKECLAIYNQLEENYETGCYAFDVLPSPQNDEVGKMLRVLKNKYSGVRGLGQYICHWHKMRFVMLVHDGRKKEAFIEYIKTWPYGLFNLDCYYRLFLNLLPCKLHAGIKQLINKP